MELQVDYSRLEKAIVKYSVNKNVLSAFNEFKRIGYFEAGIGDKSNCICGTPILHVNVFGNIKNNKVVYIGSECIQYFDKNFTTFQKHEHNLASMMKKYEKQMKVLYLQSEKALIKKIQMQRARDIYKDIEGSEEDHYELNWITDFLIKKKQKKN